MIKFWSFIYRLTGWYSPVARLAEYRHIQKSLPEIEKQYNWSGNDMSLDDVVGLYVGLWQCKMGFARQRSKWGRKIFYSRVAAKVEKARKAKEKKK